MAKARMLHNKISNSLQVHRLSLPARLLFTWMIAHADDDGRLNGEAVYIKGKVIPMTEYTEADVESFLKEMVELNLIYRWELDSNLYIEFPLWLEYQKIRKNRYHESNLPAYKDNQRTAIVQPKDNQRATQSNIVKSSKINNKVITNKGETSRKDYREQIIDPLSFSPTDNDTYTAFEVFKRLEPNNHSSLRTTYLAAINKGVPAHILFQFASEIEQDEKVRNPGAVFNTKIITYMREKQKLNGLSGSK